MTHEALAAFLRTLATDTGLQEKVSEFAAREGFRFEPGELNDIALDQIAGGIVVGTCIRGTKEQ